MVDVLVVVLFVLLLTSGCSGQSSKKNNDTTVGNAKNETVSEIHNQSTKNEAASKIQVQNVEMKSYINEDFSFEHSDKYLLQQESDNGAMWLSSDNAIIGVSIDKVDKLVNLQEGYQYVAPETVISEVEKQLNAEFEVRDLAEIDFNGSTWIKKTITYHNKNSATDYVHTILAACKNGNVYVFSYMIPAEMENIIAEEREAIMETISINTPEGILGSEIALEMLVGEWNTSNGGGFIVFEEDHTIRWYKDESKDENNVKAGIYRCENRIQTNNGYQEGVYVMVHYDEFCIDGVKTEVDRLNDYTFIFVEGENYYYGKNLVNGDEFHAIKK